MKNHEWKAIKATNSNWRIYPVTSNPNNGDGFIVGGLIKEQAERIVEFHNLDVVNCGEGE